MGAEEVTRFLYSLAVNRQVAASTQNQAMSALLFLYRDVLGVDLPWLDGIVRAKHPCACRSSSLATRSAPCRTGSTGCPTAEPMSRSGSSSPEKIQAAKAALADCLAGVEAALEEVRPGHPFIERMSVIETPVFRHRLQNKILMIALSLQRLEDAARRLLKRVGHDTRPFDRTLRSSVPIRVVSRLANSWKHGLGGQRGNATFLNGVLAVRRNDGFRDAADQERVHVVGMLVTDALDGAFASDTLVSAAVQQWAALLQPIFSDAPAWAERVVPPPQGPVVQVPQGVKADVPLGATVVFELPHRLQKTMTDEAKRRGQSA